MASAEQTESNGLVEMINQTLYATLEAFVNMGHTDWSEKLGSAVLTIHTVRQSTEEITPFELLCGRIPCYTVKDLPHNRRT